MGDLGRSITYDVPIHSLILSRLQVTVPLAILSMIFAVFISIPMGAYSALHRNQVGDYGIMVFSQIGLAVPAFWAGILLILLFAVTLHWFPAEGFRPGRASESPEVPLPAFSLGLGERCSRDDPILHARNFRVLYQNRPKQRTVREDRDL
jgi:peptide/nickel transport system permease protein